MKVQLQVAPTVRRQVSRGLSRAVVRTVASAGRRVGVTDATLTLRITDDEEVARLHATFMGLQGPTDVLSFPAEADERSLGDLVIGWGFTVRQSAWRGQGPLAWQAETIDLALHGLAHLLGHDHATRHDAREMLRLERTLARRAAMPAPVRPYA
ncbi:MAG: rRNA maturation RNase YbeY [Nannocystaceae bacterium]|nr:rRNA maturation RNase YbeY [bacterium]